MKRTLVLTVFTAALLASTPGLAEPRVGAPATITLPRAAPNCDQCFAVVTAQGQITSGRGLTVNASGTGFYQFKADRSVRGCAINATTISELSAPEAQTLKANHPAIEYSFSPDRFTVYMISGNGQNRSTPFTVSVTC